MVVPRFGWPPKFLNQAVQEMCAFEGNPARLSMKSPGVESIVRNAIGHYTITLNAEKYPNGLFGLGFLTGNDPYWVNGDQPVGNTTEVWCWDSAGNNQDPDLAFVLFVFPPISWIIPAP